MQDEKEHLFDPSLITDQWGMVLQDNHTYQCLTQFKTKH